MRLFITPNVFLSVIKQDELYSCLRMELIHGFGMHPASIYDENQTDVVASVYGDDLPKCYNSIEEVIEYHSNLFYVMNESR